jgi:hypothetical protein
VDLPGVEIGVLGHTGADPAALNPSDAPDMHPVIVPLVVPTAKRAFQDGFYFPLF